MQHKNRHQRIWLAAESGSSDTEPLRSRVTEESYNSKGVQQWSPRAEKCSRTVVQQANHAKTESYSEWNCKTAELCSSRVGNQKSRAADESCNRGVVQQQSRAAIERKSGIAQQKNRAATESCRSGTAQQRHRPAAESCISRIMQ